MLLFVSASLRGFLAHKWCFYVFTSSSLRACLSLCTNFPFLINRLGLGPALIASS